MAGGRFKAWELEIKAKKTANGQEDDAPYIWDELSRARLQDAEDMSETSTHPK